MKLSLKELKPEQHFTQPPAHYTEASLVKTMEELGIGRPSTYAPTITTIISRRYVAKEQKNLYVTELGEVVNNIMKQAFPSIVDVNFTATMEGLLDCVAAGTVKWKTVVSNFYPDLKKDVDAAEEELEKVDIQDEVTDVICENCGRHMVIKYGPHGRFLACPGFPECKIPNHILRRSGWHVRNVEKRLCLRKQKKDVSTTDVRIIRIVISCPGRNHQQRNARNVEAIWWKRGISLSAARRHVDM